MPASASYLLELPSAPVADAESFDVPAELSVLGNCLVQPMERTLADFVTASGEELVKRAVEQILITRAGSPSTPGFTQGELPWDSSFGSLIYLLRHKNNDPILAELAVAYVTEALERNEPRVRAKLVEAFADEVNLEVLHIRVTYDILSTAGSDVVVPDVVQEVTV